MNITGMTYMIARDVEAGKLTMDEAMRECGHLIDRDTLENALYSLDVVTDNEDGTVTIRLPDYPGTPACVSRDTPTPPPQ